MESHKELEALISLLDDPDENIYDEIEKKIISYGPTVIPELEDAWNTHHDTLLQERVENIIHKIQFKVTLHELEKWVDRGGKELLQGAIIISKYFYPELEVSKILVPVKQLTMKVWEELNSYLSSLEIINLINQVIFGKFDFRGDPDFLQDKLNNSLLKLLESKKGNPITLSILYLIVAEQLKLSIYGVNLFQNFVVCFCKKNIDDFDQNNQSQVLFYINPFNKGEVFNRAEIDHYLDRIGAEKLPQNYEPCTNLTTIQAQLEWIIMQYDAKQDHTLNIDEIQKMIAVIQSVQPDPDEDLL